MIPYVSPACTVLRRDYASRRRESLIQPAAPAFSLQDSCYGRDDSQMGFDKKPVTDMQSLKSRLQADMEFQRVLWSIEHRDSEPSAYCEFV